MTSERSSTSECIDQLYAWIWEAGITLDFADVCSRIEEYFGNTENLKLYFNEEQKSTQLLFAARGLQQAVKEINVDSSYRKPLWNLLKVIIDLLREGPYTDRKFVLQLFNLYQAAQLFEYTLVRVHGDIEIIEEREFLPLSYPFDEEKWKKVKNILSFKDDIYKERVASVAEFETNYKHLSKGKSDPKDNKILCSGLRSNIKHLYLDLLKKLRPAALLNICSKQNAEELKRLNFMGHRIILDNIQNNNITTESLHRIITELEANPSQIQSTLNLSSSPGNVVPFDFDLEKIKRSSSPTASVRTSEKTLNGFHDNEISKESISETDNKSTQCKNLKKHKYDLVVLNGALWEIRNDYHDNDSHSNSNSNSNSNSSVNGIPCINQEKAETHNNRRKEKIPTKFMDIRSQAGLSEVSDKNLYDQLCKDINHLDELINKVKTIVVEMEKKSLILKEKRNGRGSHGNLSCEANSLYNGRDSHGNFSSEANVLCNGRGNLGNFSSEANEVILPAFNILEEVHCHSTSSLADEILTIESKANKIVSSIFDGSEPLGKSCSSINAAVTNISNKNKSQDISDNDVTNISNRVIEDRSNIINDSKINKSHGSNNTDITNSNNNTINMPNLTMPNLTLQDGIECLNGTKYTSLVTSTPKGVTVSADNNTDTDISMPILLSYKDGDCLDNKKTKSKSNAALSPIISTPKKKTHVLDKGSPYVKVVSLSQSIVDQYTCPIKRKENEDRSFSKMDIVVTSNHSSHETLVVVLEPGTEFFKTKKRKLEGKDNLEDESPEIIKSSEFFTEKSFEFPSQKSVEVLTDRSPASAQKISKSSTKECQRSSKEVSIPSDMRSSELLHEKLSNSSSETSPNLSLEKSIKVNNSLKSLHQTSPNTKIQHSPNSSMISSPLWEVSANIPAQKFTLKKRKKSTTTESNKTVSENSLKDFVPSKSISRTKNKKLKSKNCGIFIADSLWKTICGSSSDDVTSQCSSSTSSDEYNDDSSQKKLLPDASTSRVIEGKQEKNPPITLGISDVAASCSNEGTKVKKAALSSSSTINDDFAPKGKSLSHANNERITGHNSPINISSPERISLDTSDTEFYTPTSTKSTVADDDDDDEVTVIYDSAQKSNSLNVMNQP